MASEGERIARLEERYAASLRDREVISEKLDKLASDVSDIKGQLHKYQGFIGGIVFVVTAISGAVGAVGMSIWHRLTGQA